MTDRQMLEQIFGMLKAIVEDVDEDVYASPCYKPDSGGGELPQVAVVKSPLSGTNFMWIRRQAGDSDVEEIKSIISFGKG